MKRLLKKRERIMLSITGAVILSGIVFNIMIIPVIKKNDNLNKEINSTRDKLKQYLILLTHKEGIQNKYRKFSTNPSLFSTKEDTLVSTLSELENLAHRSDIRIIDIRPQLPQSQTLYKEIIISVKTEGTIESHLKFIYNLEGSLLLLRVRKFQLNSLPNSSNLEGNFSISKLSITQ